MVRNKSFVSSDIKAITWFVCNPVEVINNMRSYCKSVPISSNWTSDSRLPSVRELLLAAFAVTLLLVTLYQQNARVVIFCGSKSNCNRNMVGRQFGFKYANLTEKDYDFDNTMYHGKYMRNLLDYELPEKAWFTSEKCVRLVTRFTRNDQTATVWLASFPRSGNTWTRYLLEAATGVFTSAATSSRRKLLQKLAQPADKARFAKTWKSHLLKRLRGGQGLSELLKMGYLGESASWILHNTIVHKAHAEPDFWSRNQSEDSLFKRRIPFEQGSTRRAIVLIRDPFKALISLKKFGDNHSILAAKKRLAEYFAGDDWESYALFHSRHWYELNMAWLERTNKSLIVPYEMLQDKPMQQLRRMLSFLKVVPDSGREQCLREQLEGIAHNKKHDILPDVHIFSFKTRASIWALIHQLNVNLQGRGHPGLPVHLYSFAAEFASGVVS